MQHTVGLLLAFSVLAQGDRHLRTDDAPRRVFIDLGANWANTMRLFEEIGTKTHEKPWEVYAFEASPFIQPYLENFTAWLNGQGPKPPVTVPPSGSSVHLNEFAPRYGCPNSGSDAMRSCMFEVFKVPLSQLHPDPALKNAALIKSKLNTASTAAVGVNRFVSVPAAAGAKDGVLSLGSISAEQMIRGGASDTFLPGETTFSVPMVDVPRFLQFFRHEDYVVVKMDIEGGEFPILDKLLASPDACVIDVLAMECHAFAGDCTALKNKLSQHPCIQVLEEGDAGGAGGDYPGWDHHSSPDKYYAIDPRTEEEKSMQKLEAQAWAPRAWAWLSGLVR